ncbi:MAG: DNA polymerase IV [Treponemataceae bacterium]|nr:DNA polymerase IV [Treponemataceae bacterium]
MTSNQNRTCYLHIDLDAFFASVEQLDFPEYKGKPVIVGGLPSDKRSVVSTCSYEARKFGVHSAMPIFKAYQLCPQGIYLKGRMRRYQEKSKEVMSIFYNYSPEIMQISIDEAFLDLTGTERLFGNPTDTAKKIKDDIFEKTGLTVSVGVASSKYLAKIASGLRKPNGLFVIPYGKEQDFMFTLPIEKIWGIGNKTRERITEAGFYTIKSIYNASEELLTSLFGKCTGKFLYNTVRGINNDTFSGKPKSQSISEEQTYPRDITEEYIIDTALLELCSNCMFRMLSEEKNSKTICVKIRYEDFTTVTIQETFQHTIKSIEELFENAKNLFYQKYERGRGIRLLGVGFHNIQNGIDDPQGELFDFGEKKKQAIEKTILELKQKNPKIPIKKARLID